MPATTSEIGIRELRAGLSDVVNETAVRGRITYITSRGRRLAAVVPVPDAEALDAARRNARAIESLKAAIDALPDEEKAPFLTRWYDQMVARGLEAAEAEPDS